MKKMFSILIITGFIACSGETDPRPVAENFLNAMQKHDYKEASQYATKETVKLLKQLEKMEELSNNRDVNEQSGKVSITSVDIKGDMAIVYFLEEGNENQQKITLKRVAEEGSTEKEWKVALKKEEVPLKLDPANSNSENKPADKIPA